MSPIIILTRVLFIACLVFIIGYVFGNFSAKPALATFTKIATVFVIVMFIASNIFLFRFGRWNQQHNGKYYCGWYQKDTVNVK